MSTYVERLVDKATQAEQPQDQTEPPQYAVIKLTPSQIDQVEKFSAALGLAFGVMLNSAAKYAVFYAQGKSVQVNQLDEYPQKVGTELIKEKITLATRSQLENAGIKFEYLSECIITGIQLLYKKLIATDDNCFKEVESPKALIDSISNKTPLLKRKLGKNWITQIGLEVKGNPAASSCSIDGTGFINGKRIFFQSNLRKRPLDKKVLKSLSHQFKQNKTEIAIILAIRYAKTFTSQLKQETLDIANLKCHLLTLDDCLNKTAIFQDAVKDLTALGHLDIEGGLC